MVGHKKQWSPPLEFGLPGVLKCSGKCLTPLGQMFHTLRTNVLLSQAKCHALPKQISHPLKTTAYTIKTMTSSEIVVAPSHGTKNFCVFDANTHSK